jgi:hypothetical protein
MGQEVEDAMSADGKHSSSKPPPSRPQSLPEYAAEKAHRASRSAASALELAQEACESSKRIEAAIGVPPNPSIGVSGSGLFLGLARVHHRLDTIEADKQAADVTARAVAEAKAVSRARWSSFGRSALAFLGAAATAIGIIKALGGGH